MDEKILKILFILMPRDFQDKEFQTPYTMLQRAGYHSDIAGFSLEPAQGMNNLTVHPTKVVTDLTEQELDTYQAVVIPGGSGSPTYLWDNDLMQRIVRFFYEKNKLVATICYACMVPAQAGILTNRHATIYPTDLTRKMFTRYNILFSEDPLVESAKNIITAQGPTYAESFGKTILDWLKHHASNKQG